MKKHISFTTNQPASGQGKTNTWFTPESIISELAPFDLDPCTQSYRPFDTAKNHYCEDLGDDGLLYPWTGRVWLNPPYGRFIREWLNKLAHHKNGIALVFARTETNWAQYAFETCNAVNFLHNRIEFIPSDPAVKSDRAACGSMLLAYGEANVETIKKLKGTVFVP